MYLKTVQGAISPLATPWSGDQKYYAAHPYDRIGWEPSKPQTLKQKCCSFVMEKQKVLLKFNINLN